ncbi:hypothetical protein ASF26_05335 [Methylobacterium sp. Leaf93]|nr:hypothetical protein ASF26_05335 [Methylobacterium sp. Leaf93]
MLIADRIVSTAALDIVGAEPPFQNVATTAAFQGVIARATLKDVVATGAFDIVIAGTGKEHIPPLAAVKT